MADALCGPSNPLQSFRKHTQVDRTLQQDRLVGPRHSPVEGFRTPDTRSAIADAELHAFENSPSNFAQLRHPELYNASPISYTPPPMQGWAADFQNLQISGPTMSSHMMNAYGPPQAITRPLQVSQFRTEAPLIKSTNGGWHNEFVQQRSNAHTPVFEGKQAVRGPQINGYSTQMPYMNSFGQSSFEPHYGVYQEQNLGQHQQQDQSQVQNEVFKDRYAQEMFEKQFAELDNMTTLQGHDILHQDGVYTNEHIQEDTQQIPRTEQLIGSDAIQYVEQQDRTTDQSNRDADELARTAGHLLNLVQHDQSEKFQNSQFLDLMRKIRDREVRVQGNELQNTNQTSINDAQESTQRQHAGTEEMQQQQPLLSHDPNNFQFPNMNSVYAPELELEDHTRTRYPGSWDYPVTSKLRPMHLTEMNRTDRPNVDHNYNIDSDQYPQSQIQALHPGGRMYPEQSPPPPTRSQQPQMSGGINIEAADFDGIEENQVFASRYQKED